MLDMLNIFLNYRSDRKDDEIKQFNRVDIKVMLSNPPPFNRTCSWPEPTRRQARWSGDDGDSLKAGYLQEGSSGTRHRRWERPFHQGDQYFKAGLLPDDGERGVPSPPRRPTPHPLPDQPPERFLEKDMDVKGQDFDVLPFGTGRRSYCDASRASDGPLLSCLAVSHLRMGFRRGDVERSDGESMDQQNANGLIGMPKPRLSEHVYAE